MRNQGYTHDAWDKPHPLKLVWAWLEVSKFRVLESEKKTSLTCFCLCKWQHKIKPSEITYTHFEVKDVTFKTPKVLQTMYNWFILACAKFQNDQLTGTEGKWSFQFLADFALLMAQNASFGNRGFWLVEKKRKVSCLAESGSEELKQVAYPVFMCTLHPLVHIDIYKSMYLLRYRVLSVYYI